MSEEMKAPRNWITIRVKPEEYTIVYSLFKKTTCKKLSQYVRRVLLEKPVRIEYRDATSNEILSALNQLSRELSAIGNNFNQAVHKLHTLDHIPEIKFWAEMSASTQQNLVKKVEEIRNSLNEIRRQCAHK